jgi:hypothetical protein
MANKVRFAFTEVDPILGALSTLPYLPLTLTYQGQSLNVSGLLDTGSSVNVLPYEMGLALGAVWENQRLSLPLGGNLDLKLVHPQDWITGWTVSLNPSALATLVTVAKVGLPSGDNALYSPSLVKPESFASLVIFLARAMTLNAWIIALGSSSDSSRQASKYN